MSQPIRIKKPVVIEELFASDLPPKIASNYQEFDGFNKPNLSNILEDSVEEYSPSVQNTELGISAWPEDKSFKFMRKTDLTGQSVLEILNSRSLSIPTLSHKEPNSRTRLHFCQSVSTSGSMTPPRFCVIKKREPKTSYLKDCCGFDESNSAFQQLCHQENKNNRLVELRQSPQEKDKPIQALEKDLLEECERTDSKINRLEAQKIPTTFKFKGIRQICRRKPCQNSEKSEVKVKDDSYKSVLPATCCESNSVCLDEHPPQHDIESSKNLNDSFKASNQQQFSTFKFKRNLSVQLSACSGDTTEVFINKKPLNLPKKRISSGSNRKALKTRGTDLPQATLSTHPLTVKALLPQVTSQNQQSASKEGQKQDPKEAPKEALKAPHCKKSLFLPRDRKPRYFPANPSINSPPQNNGPLPPFFRIECKGFLQAKNYRFPYKVIG